jgi:hypothetical protein
LSIGLGVFLAIKISYATIEDRNVTYGGVNAICDSRLIGAPSQRCLKIARYFQLFSHGWIWLPLIGNYVP